MKRPIDPALTADWLTPGRTDPGVRRDTRKLLAGIDKRHTLEAAERLRSFDRPTLLAWAPEDKVFPFAHAERFAELAARRAHRARRGRADLRLARQPRPGGRPGAGRRRGARSGMIAGCPNPEAARPSAPRRPGAPCSRRGARSSRERGYAAVGTEEVVRRARVTRGALYHHFADKKALFRAVFEDLERELVGELGGRILAIEDPWELLAAGIRAFLELTTDQAVARISLTDAPAVLGWEEWREIDARYGLGLVKVGLQRAMDEGAMTPAPVDPLAHLLLGALGEAGMMVAHAADRDAARREVEPALLALLEGLAGATRVRSSQ